MPDARDAALEQSKVDFIIESRRLRAGGGDQAIERQHAKGRLTARERIARLVDPAGQASHPHHHAAAAPLDPHADELPGFLELGLFAAHGMYQDYGGAPAAGVVTGIGRIHGRAHVIVANDATVKAGAFFPMTCKKVIRAQSIALMARLPVVYLVDSAGVFLPLQEDVFPDTDDFGRVFYLNSRLSAEGIAQTAAIMGNCVAGGGYLPVLCDTLLMTEGSGLYLAGPALVKAAIGQQIDDEQLGGARMHASISGTVDYHEPDDEACLRRLRSILAAGADRAGPVGEAGSAEAHEPRVPGPVRSPSDIAAIFTTAPGRQYDVRDVLGCILDSRAVPNDDGAESLQPHFDEYRPDFGASLVCGHARIGGVSVGIVASQGRTTDAHRAGGRDGPSKTVNLPRVIYHDSADKAARFVMECNQRRVPILFIQDTTGFMVGRDSEQAGVIRAGAKLVNAVSNSVVPKIVLITGGSYGAGAYALCGRAFDPFLTLAWPSATCAVMGPGQAAGTLALIEEKARAGRGERIDPEQHEAILDRVRRDYTQQASIYHGAARGWLDRIIAPEDTRAELIACLRAARERWDFTRPFVTGVLQT